MLDQKYLSMLTKQGKDVRKVEEQIQFFVKGFPYMELDRPATVGDGIRQLSDKDLKKAIHFYDNSQEDVKIIKFVPASGAASRMFKSLYAFMKSCTGTDDDYEKLKTDPEFETVLIFFNQIQNFAFYEDLKEVLEGDGLHLEERVLKRDYRLVLEYLLTEKGLNYGNLPKGLLKFHRYEKKSRTPVEEHMVEGALYCRDGNGRIFIHFTVSPEHEPAFKIHVEDLTPIYCEAYKAGYDVQYSRQKPVTDTIAVDPDNNPFITEEGEILFRPGGHGALIENLNDLDSDIIFIKNIDNVVPDRLKDVTVKYKKALAGVLLEYQERIFYYLTILDEVKTLSPSFIEEIDAFLKNDLCVELTPNQEHIDARDYFFRKLSRPIRVCGIVKNEGEPGGGPFWCKNPDGTISLQIVESAQVNIEKEDQKKILSESTHFNPVDLVCGVMDYKGKKFDLTRYIDPQTGFISVKSMGGRDLKALELPGLWNGSMSDWNTVFVEVPIETFNPVKIVNDLLREQHQ
ncbi:MAG: DUF4301 family protein [Cyclobacteriaceae bacterium]|nr:DUF4301 family protein [Cyclobacteriaceae bacterium]